MIGQHSTTTVGSLRQGTGRRWLVGGALLAVAVVGAIGVWQVRERSTSTTPSREAAASVARAATGPAAARTSGAATTELYLVDSFEEAAFIRGVIQQLGQQQVLDGAQPMQTSVLVGSTIDRSVLNQLPGMSGALIVDLRAHADAGGAAAEAHVPSVTATAPAFGGDAHTRQLEALTAESLGIHFQP